MTDGVATEQRVAVVTGAARGLGAAVVRRLVADGLRVVAVDWPVGAAHGLPAVAHPLAVPDDLARLTDLGDRVVVVEGDVGEPDTSARAVQAATEAFGRLDVAVACAAVIAGGRPLWETSPETFEVLWRTDVLGVTQLAAASVPAMLAGPDPSGCRFVAVASSAGTRGLFGLSAYVMAKHAVVGLVRGLAADLVGTGVTAVAVAPGAMRTDLLDATAVLYGVAGDDLAAASLLRELLDPTTSRRSSRCAAPAPAGCSTARSSPPTAAPVDQAGGRLPSVFRDVPTVSQRLTPQCGPRHVRGRCWEGRWRPWLLRDRVCRRLIATSPIRSRLRGSRPIG